MSTELDAIARLARVEPPRELDALVRVRSRAVILERRGELGRDEASSQRSTAPRAPVAATVPLAERCAYVLGLLAYGAQASAAHWVWHALTSVR
jgi:hypothetical protein